MIAELRNRIKSPSKYQGPALISTRLKFQTGTERRLGPGSYLVNYQKSIESHRFSPTPRLKTPITHNILTIDNLYSVNKSYSTEIIKKNKMLSSNPELRKAIHFSKYSNETHRKEVKIKKKEIECIIQNEKSKNLKRKFQLFEWRTMKKELKIFQRSWFVLFSAYGLYCSLENKLNIRKEIKRKAACLLKHFVIICQVVGKLSLVLKKVRRKIMAKIFFNVLSPLENYAIGQVRENKKIILNSLMFLVGLPSISKVMIKFNLNIIKVQRALRRYKKVKTARIEGLKRLWANVITGFKNNSDRPSARDLRFFTGRTIERLLAKYIQKIMRRYLSKTLRYFKKLKEINKFVYKYSYPLGKPRLHIYNKHLLSKFIEKAIKSKSPTN